MLLASLYSAACRTNSLVTLCEACQKMPTMLRKLPNFLGAFFNCLMGFLMDIEVTPDASFILRASLCTSILVAVCKEREKAPGMMRKLPNFLGAFFDCLMRFLMDIEVSFIWQHTSLGRGSQVMAIQSTRLKGQVLAVQNSTVLVTHCDLLEIWKHKASSIAEVPI